MIACARSQIEYASNACVEVIENASPIELKSGALNHDRGDVTVAGIRSADFEISQILAVEAVIGEPVSVSEFPVSRENTGKFAA